MPVYYSFTFYFIVIKKAERKVLRVKGILTKLKSFSRDFSRSFFGFRAWPPMLWRSGYPLQASSVKLKNISLVRAYFGRFTRLYFLKSFTPWAFHFYPSRIHSLCILHVKLSILNLFFEIWNFIFWPVDQLTSLCSILFFLTFYIYSTFIRLSSEFVSINLL